MKSWQMKLDETYWSFPEEKMKGTKVTGGVEVSPLVGARFPEGGWLEDTAALSELCCCLSLVCRARVLCSGSWTAGDGSCTWCSWSQYLVLGYGPTATVITRLLSAALTQELRTWLSCLRLGFENSWKSNYILKALGSWLLKICPCRR